MTISPLAARTTWTDEELRTAVAQSRSWRGVLRAMGRNESSAGVVRGMQRRAEELRLDTSHFTGQRRWSEKQLRAAIDEAESWADVIKHLGLTDNGENRTAVRRHAARLDLDTAPLSERLPDRPSQGLAQLSNLRRSAEPLAVAWFELRGHSTAIPSNAQPYDFLAEIDGRLRRVQVKSTTYRDPGSRSWMVRVGRRVPGPTKNGPLMPYTSEEIDMFFIVDGDLDLYLIPVEATRGSIALNLKKYEKYKMGTAAGLM
ncbi:group I intron-associated PD-(D/E)XK endonuclease [Streptosporangium sp. NPDC004379]|uniref:group I intron-associated PD-(D/E)XK endonuclease n=1 Tax=Streptosporangium sp. NPDC004379 TaxID=3366189 RepID=UPI0036CE8401